MSVHFRQPLTTQPDLLALHRMAPRRYPHILASTARGGPLAHFSLLFIGSDERLVLWPDGKLEGPFAKNGFLDSLQSWYGQQQDATCRPDPLLPFLGGWFLLLGYELAGEIEPRLQLPVYDAGCPVAMAQRCPGAVIINHVTGEATVVAEDQALIDLALTDIERLHGELPGPEECQLNLEVDDPQHYIDGVLRSQQYILDGDVFQVNLSRSWRGQAECELDPADLYLRLSENNAAPFAGLCSFDCGTLISSSPERLVEVRGRAVQTRPIAGTRPRGADALGDEALSRELIGHPKERAEHIMLIDLERNDLGRVCEPGSVDVDELMVIESYAHVHHIVSNVRGRLQPGATPVDVIRALFPGGTITGCPKVRCMEIIAELEGQGRGFYTGSMGYLGTDGSMDLNILIRSMFVSGNRLNFRTGAGIVADSIPEREVQETEAKAKGLLLSLGVEHA